LGGDSAVLATAHDHNAGSMNWVLEKWCWRRILIIKWTDIITSDEVFQRTKRRKINFKNFKK
jgi:hypothetical protein